MEIPMMACALGCDAILDQHRMMRRNRLEPAQVERPYAVEDAENKPEASCWS
jgi:hypothetical protein